MSETKVTQVVTAQEVKDYLGIDWSDDATERRIERAIAVADKFMEGAIGVNYPRDDVRAQELALNIIADVFDNRTLTQKETAVYRKLAHDLELQLKLELRD